MEKKRERERESAQTRLHLRGATPLRAENRRYGIAAIAATNKIRVGGTKGSPLSRPRVLSSLSPFYSLSRKSISRFSHFSPCER